MLPDMWHFHMCLYKVSNGSYTIVCACKVCYDLEIVLPAYTVRFCTERRKTQRERGGIVAAHVLADGGEGEIGAKPNEGDFSLSP
jgi:hypothetical protein